MAKERSARQEVFIDIAAGVAVYLISLSVAYILNLLGRVSITSDEVPWLLILGVFGASLFAMALLYRDERRRARSWYDNSQFFKKQSSVLKDQVRQLQDARVWGYLEHFTTQLALTEKDSVKQIPIEFDDDEIRIRATERYGREFVLGIYNPDVRYAWQGDAPDIVLPAAAAVGYPLHAYRGTWVLEFRLPAGGTEVDVSVVVERKTPVARGDTKRKES